MNDRYALAVIAALAFAGCGGAGRTVPQGALVQSPAHKESGSSGALLYVSQFMTGGWNIAMFTYPQLQPVGSFVPLHRPWRLCSDDSGNVWVPSEDVVYEYAHGGTSPIQSLSANLFMDACAVDPTTGNLAVLGQDEYGYGKPEIAIWSNAQGDPTLYTPPFNAFADSYDDHGNLFFDGSSPSLSFMFGELPKGSSTFRTIILDKRATFTHDVQWDGKYITVNTHDDSEPKNHRDVVYRVKVSGSTGTVVGTTYLTDENSETAPDWIEGDTILGVTTDMHVLGLWRYPKGHKPFEKITGLHQLWGITVSAAPSGPRK